MKMLEAIYQNKKCILTKMPHTETLYYLNSQDTDLLVDIANKLRHFATLNFETELRLQIKIHSDLNYDAVIAYINKLLACPKIQFVVEDGQVRTLNIFASDATSLETFYYCIRHMAYDKIGSYSKDTLTGFMILNKEMSLEYTVNLLNVYAQIINENGNYDV